MKMRALAITGLQWLAARLGIEAPFLAYHAALALLTAVRSLHLSHSTQLKDAIDRAEAEFRRTYTGPHPETSDRHRLLEEAERQLERRRAPTS